jgi:uncharacterized protein (UPF0332 family)
MEDATKRAYIGIRLARAQDDLANAKDDLAHGHLRGAVNRAYYAVFHTSSAALLWIGVERARHSGTQSAFGEYLVKSGQVEPEFGKIYSTARKAREEQDYDLEVAALSEQDVERIVTDAERFVARLEDHLRQAGAIE